jgi:hypothetical protein
MKLDLGQFRSHIIVLAAACKDGHAISGISAHIEDCVRYAYADAYLKEILTLRADVARNTLNMLQAVGILTVTTPIIC